MRRWTVFVLAMALALASQFSAAHAQDVSLDGWAKAYREAISYALERSWFTRSVNPSQMIQVSLEVMAVKTGDKPPVLTGNVQRDIDTAVQYFRLSFPQGDEFTKQEFFRQAVDGLVKRWDRWASTMSPEDALMFAIMIGFVQEGDGIIFSWSLEHKKYLVSEVLPESGGEKAGIRIGDEVVSIGGMPFDKMTDADWYRIKSAARKAGKIVYGIKRDGAVFDVTVEYRRRDKPAIYYDLMAGGVGLIKVPSVESTAGYEVVDAMTELLSRGARSVVLDLRENPGGYPWAGQIIISVFKQGDLYVRRSREGAEVIKSVPTEVTFAGPLAILVDQHSASAAEVITFALKSRPNTRIFGENTQTTNGKGVGQEGFQLSNGWVFFFTVEQFEDFKGFSYHGLGVRVDEMVVGNAEATVRRAVAWLLTHK